jgi:hypothetical protein
MDRTFATFRYNGSESINKEVVFFVWPHIKLAQVILHYTTLLTFRTLAFYKDTAVGVQCVTSAFRVEPR